MFNSSYNTQPWSNIEIFCNFAAIPKPWWWRAASLCKRNNNGIATCKGAKPHCPISKLVVSTCVQNRVKSNASVFEADGDDDDITEAIDVDDADVVDDDANVETAEEDEDDTRDGISPFVDVFVSINVELSSLCNVTVTKSAAVEVDIDRDFFARSDTAVDDDDDDDDAEFDGIDNIVLA